MTPHLLATATGDLAYLLRVSTDDQERDATPETQLFACQGKARELGRDPESGRVYLDTWKGDDYFGRPELTLLWRHPRGGRGAAPTSRRDRRKRTRRAPMR